MIRYAAALTAALAFAQQPRLVLTTPPDAATVRKNITYQGEYAFDVYRPPSASRPLPAVIFLNSGSDSMRGTGYLQDWARATVAAGLAAVVADISPDNLDKTFDALLEHLRRNAGDLGIDGAGFAVWGASGNAYRALPLAQNPNRTVVKAAVILYGGPAVKEFRSDLPVLLVRAGLDRPAVNRNMDTLAREALAQNAPVTVLNYPGGRHGFDVFDNNDLSREVIRQTIAWLRSALDPSYQASLRAGIPAAQAAAAVMKGDFATAASLYGRLVAASPDDRNLALSYGEALVGAGRYKEALTQFTPLKGKVGPRDLGVPAARASMLAGDADGAIAWIDSIPKRFRPMSLKDDTVFAPLKDRPDFLALFQP